MGSSVSRTEWLERRPDVKRKPPLQEPGRRTGAPSTLAISQVNPRSNKWGRTPPSPPALRSTTKEIALSHLDKNQSERGVDSHCSQPEPTNTDTSPLSQTMCHQSSSADASAPKRLFHAGGSENSELEVATRAKSSLHKMPSRDTPCRDPLEKKHESACHTPEHQHKTLGKALPPRWL